MGATKIRGQQIVLDSTKGINVDSSGKLFVDVDPNYFVFAGGQLVLNGDTTSITLNDAGTAVTATNFQNLSSDPSLGGLTRGLSWYNNTSFAMKTLDFAVAGIHNWNLDHLNTLSGTAVSNSNAETTIQVGGVNKKFTFSSGDTVASQTFRLRLGFTITNTGTPTIRFKIKLGGTTLADSGTVTTPSGLSTDAVILEHQFSVRSTGVSGTVVGNGWVIIKSVVSTFLGPSTTIDSTASNDLTVTVQWSAASNSNSIALQSWDLIRVS